MSNRIDQTRRAAEVTGRAYAEQCVTAVFELLRPAIESLLPAYPAKARLVMDKDHDDDGDTRILLLAVRGDGDDLLWFHDSCYQQHPDALAAANRKTLDLDDDLLEQVHELLQIAYDQPGRYLGPAEADDRQGLRPLYRSWNILSVEEPHHSATSAPTVLIEGTDGDEYRFTLYVDDNVIIHVDDVPLVGVISDAGPGWWPGGEGDDWQPLLLGTKVIERGLRVLGISETQFSGISERLHLPPGHFGTFRGGPDGLCAVNLSDRSWSCGDRFDAALAYVEELGLAYDLTVETRYERRPQTPPARTPGHEEAGRP